MLLKRCEVCGAPVQRGFLCEACWQKLEKESYDFSFERCDSCCSIVPFPGYECRFCEERPGFRLYIICPYEGFARKMVEDLKFNGNRGIASVLSDIFNKTIGKAGLLGEIAVIPVPASRDGIRKRGFDQMKLVSKGIDVKVLDLLEMCESSQQKQLDRAGRIEKMGSIFKLKRKSIPASISNLIVIDDICTTGATLFSAMELFRNTGKNVMGMAFLGNYSQWN